MTSTLIAMSQIRNKLMELADTKTFNLRSTEGNDIEMLNNIDIVIDGQNFNVSIKVAKI